MNNKQVYCVVNSIKNQGVRENGTWLFTSGIDLFLP